MHIYPIEKLNRRRPIRPILRRADEGQVALPIIFIRRIDRLLCWTPLETRFGGYTDRNRGTMQQKGRGSAIEGLGIFETKVCLRAL